MCNFNIVDKIKVSALMWEYLTRESTVNQLLFASEKILQGSQKPCLKPDIAEECSIKKTTLCNPVYQTNKVAANKR
jgi:hypothetical protein